MPVNLSDADADALVSEVRSGLPSGQGEPKYSFPLARAGVDGQPFCQLGGLPPGAAQVFVAHKRFMTIAKIVDLLIVEMAHEDDYDMYADGAAVGLADPHHVRPVLGDSDAYKSMLAAFVATIRPNRPATVDDLFAAIAAYLSSDHLVPDSPLSVLLQARPQATRT